MKHLFLDINIIIDFLAMRKNFAIEAAKIFNYSLEKKITLYVASVSYNNLYYILRQHNLPHSETIKTLNLLRSWTKTVDLTEGCIEKALKSEFKNFEDAIQYYTAASINKIDCIVTRNAKDFKLSSISIMTPKEALAMLKLPK